MTCHEEALELRHWLASSLHLSINKIQTVAEHSLALSAICPRSKNPSQWSKLLERESP
ncbi:MAG: hypothetical protein G8237_14355 [Magnetococcales bacterium]|nr:hypothetical protein [Magnetococcales bacterium]